MNLKSMLFAATLALASFSAHAVDGCTVVLCLANPAGWSSVSQCVPPIEQLFSDLAHGHAFPSCNMNSSSSSGQNNSATSGWASGYNCPVQYRYMGGPENNVPMCTWSGVITVTINGQPWNQTWWSFGGGSVTQSFAPAIAAGASNGQWQQDVAAYDAQQAALAAAAAQDQGH